MHNSVPVLIKPRILIVDDDSANRHLLERLLDLGGYDEIRSAMSGREALTDGMAYDPDLIILDLHMPGMDGYDVLRSLRQSHSSSIYLPILVLTADATTAARKKALELGASDFLTKPGDATEILLRVRNFLAMRAWSQEINQRNMDLEEKVRERTQELEHAQVEIVERLALAGERRDDDTGEHTKRVGEMCAKIAQELRQTEKYVELIRLAARLHDLGKIGVPDSILLKPGKLTSEEYATIQEHCMIGASILSESTTPLLQMAERIASAHHERFDGTVYPNRLKGDQIPLEARIVSVADVWDALTHERPYKQAWPRSEALDEIERQSGKQFDPLIIAAFMRIVR